MLLVAFFNDNELCPPVLPIAALVILYAYRAFFAVACDLRWIFEAKGF